MQHLPQLALAACLAAADGEPARVERLANEFRDEVLDFIAAYPPRFGVQWVTSMDVAIRVANWVLAWDLFPRGGAGRSTASSPRSFTRSVIEHGEHLAANLEWSRELRGNHYLADVIGLLFAAAYLPASHGRTRGCYSRRARLSTRSRSSSTTTGGTSKARPATTGSPPRWRRTPSRSCSHCRIRTRRGLFDPSPAVLAATRGLPWVTVGGAAVHDVGDGRLSPVLAGDPRAARTSAGVHDGHDEAFRPGPTVRGRRQRAVLPARAGRRVAAFVQVRRSLPQSRRRRCDRDSADPFLLEDHLDHRHLVDAIDGLLGRKTTASGRSASMGRSSVPSPRPHPSWPDLGESRADRVHVGSEHSLAEFEARLAGVPERQRQRVRHRTRCVDRGCCADRVPRLRGVHPSERSGLRRDPVRTSWPARLRRSRPQRPVDDRARGRWRGLDPGPRQLPVHADPGGPRTPIGP